MALSSIVAVSLVVGATGPVPQQPWVWKMAARIAWAVCNVAFGPRSLISRIGRIMAGESSQNVRNHTTIDNPTRDNPTVSKTPLKTSEGGRTRDVLKSRPPALRELAKCNVSCGGGFDQFDFALAMATFTILWPSSNAACMVVAHGCALWYVELGTGHW